ncbi:hypothetical protein [Flavobacterium macacae]|uniref:DUF4402 domain-containing protein n=1 Tax=Flavobacterium macacae TaxID=2488993 RepID=A0A3P3WKM1_9FLAO|nr:hypothetical protein [Flavobacterium macacae]RRJ93583.1 hypothetical protein EG849_01755 [Flavobacterium macacae]
MILASFIVLGMVQVNAQTATLNVKLKPIQTLTVNTAQQTVNLEYVTTADYQDGVTALKQDHLSVYSTGGFQVQVKSAEAAMQTGTKTMQVSTIKIKAAAGSDAVGNASYAPAISLSNQETTLLSSSNGAVNKKINVEYKGAGDNAYIDNYIAGQNPTAYTTTLTYTIVSQ